MLIMFLKSKLLFFLKIDQVYVFVLKITVLLENISKKMFFLSGSMSYPSLVISASEENEPSLI